MQKNNNYFEEYKSSEIAQYLKSDLIGDDILINKPVSLGECEAGTVCFIKKKFFENTVIKALYIVSDDKFIDENSIATYIKVKNPRLAFAKIVQNFFLTKKQNKISNNSAIASSAKVGTNVNIGNFCTIEDDVVIGDNTIINNNVTIAANTIIGNNCYIKSGTVIGEDGFGFDFEDDYTSIRLPHLGKVVIGDNVEIGAKCTIARGTLDDTIIKDYVKVDDQVHIAHNCIVGEKTIITACAELSGGVVIGKKCWIGPNSSIIQKITIEDNVVVGIGAVVVRDIESKKKVMGLESLELRNLIKLKNKIEYK